MRAGLIGTAAVLALALSACRVSDSPDGNAAAPEAANTCPAASATTTTRRAPSSGRRDATSTRVSRNQLNSQTAVAPTSGWSPSTR